MGKTCTTSKQQSVHNRTLLEAAKDVLEESFEVSWRRGRGVRAMWAVMMIFVPFVVMMMMVFTVMILVMRRGVIVMVRRCRRGMRMRMWVRMQRMVLVGR
jgi:hypothetical protein